MTVEVQLPQGKVEKVAGKVVFASPVVWEGELPIEAEIETPDEGRPPAGVCRSARHDDDPRQPAGRAGEAVGGRPGERNAQRDAGTDGARSSANVGRQSERNGRRTSPAGRRHEQPASPAPQATPASPAVSRKGAR